MSITHVFSRIVTYKKHKKRKILSPHRNHDIHYYFSKLCLQHTKWKKKLFHVIHTKKIYRLFCFDFFWYFNKRRKTCRLSSCIKRHLSKKVNKINNYRHSHTFKYLKTKKKYMCVLAFFYFFYYFCVWML